MKKILYLILFVSILISSCEKENQVQDEQNENSNQSNTENTDSTNQKTLNFISLTNTSDTIRLGEITRIIATAEGDGLEYHWSASSGDLIGSGNVIFFGASSCCAGISEINCTVKDQYKNEASKQISIYAY